MKIQVTASLGLAGCTRKTTFDLDDEFLAELDEMERDSVIEEEARLALWNILEWGYEIVEDKES